MRVQTVRLAVQRSRCRTCGVEAGEPCRKQYVTYLGEVRTAPADYYVHAARRDDAVVNGGQ